MFSPFEPADWSCVGVTTAAGVRWAPSCHSGLFRATIRMSVTAWDC